MPRPIPIPAMAWYPIYSAAPDFAFMVVRSPTPAAVMTLAATTTGPRFPVFDMKTPETTEDDTAPIIIGIQWMPDSTADVPLTDWNQIGSYWGKSVRLGLGKCERRREDTYKVR